MSTRCTAQQLALLKVLAHACKHPACSVNGVLLGQIQEGGIVAIMDAVPLCHNNLTLAPALEVGLAQIDAYVAIYEKRPVKIEIVGYYHSDARLQPAEVTPVARRVADKVLEKQPSAVMLMLDNNKLADFSNGKADCPFEVFAKDGSRGWKKVQESGPALSLEIPATWRTLHEDFFTMFSQQGHRKLADFDEHLDDVTKDYFNKGWSGVTKLKLPGQVL